MRRLYLPAGTRLARYELIRPIGSGASGAVYEAIDATLGRRVAVKVQPMPGGGGALAKHDEARFFREARAAAHIRHPNVVSVFDFGIEGDLAFLVMELVEGETLALLLRHEGGLGIDRTLEVLLPILSATAELHAHGVLHRDIKPANILLARGSELSPKLADFGLSRFVEEASTLTESGVTVGTPEYMAPDVMRGSHEASERSDQYSLGVVLYECVTGAKPFRGETTYEMMQSVVHGPVLPPSALEPSLPKAFDRVVLRAMNREPLRRFERIDQLADALLPFASEPAAERWRGEMEQRGRPWSLNRKQAGEQFARISVNDGVALARNGDLFTVLWKAPARMSRIRWVFDRADRFAEARPEGFVGLDIVLPSSSPPDHQATIEIIERLRKLRHSMRRQAIVAIGGGIWQSVVQGVHRVIFDSMYPRSGRVTFSGTIDEGIRRVLERASVKTPEFPEIREDVVALHEALELTPESCVTTPRKRASRHDRA